MTSLKAAEDFERKIFLTPCFQEDFVLVAAVESTGLSIRYDGRVRTIGEALDTMGELVKWDTGD